MLHLQSYIYALVSRFRDGFFQLLLQGENPGGGSESASDSVGTNNLVRHWIQNLDEALRAGVAAEGDVLDRRVAWFKVLILVLVTIVVAVAIWWVSRKILLGIVHRLAVRTKTTWDDHLVENRFFSRIAWIGPGILVDAYAKLIFADFEGVAPVVQSLADAYIAWIIMLAIVALFNTIRDIIKAKPRMADKPVDSYFQLGKIATYFIFGVLIISVLTDKSPIYFFSAMGAMTAVLILVFKDTILGFVASIQLAANDMVRVGDWVTMERYGADGDITEINLTTVKVQNFDNTITTIPTYAFISDSFRNWRGMQESPGRRIKRSVSVNINSIRFCTAEMLDRYARIKLVADYVAQRQQEIERYNDQAQIDKSESVNGRHMTNIGVFRAYLTAYLKENDHLHPEMTLMVRQLAPTETGLPIEVYAFSKDKNWVNYEAIISDIFDHVLAAAPDFGLEVFQNPTGRDFQKLSDASAS